jgi:MFS transporter, DHA1 family, multidrug resistance protein
MSKRYRLFIILFTAAIMAFGPFVTDFYLPSLPQLGVYFKTSASLIQLTITVSLIGLAVGQLFIGPLSDKYGRKKPLLVSLSLFILSTAGCIYSDNIEKFLFFRLIQGFTGAGGVVISRSIATDLYKGSELSKFFSMLSGIQAIAPICAPVLGGVIISFTKWQGIFWTLLIIGVLLLIACMKFKESIAKVDEHSILTVFKSYIPVLKNKTFGCYVAIQALSMGVMFTYIAASPFIFQQKYGMSPIAYSICFAFNAFGIMLGSLCSLKFKTAEKAIKTGVSLFFAATILTGTTLVFEAGIVAIEISILLTLFFVGMILPTSTTLAMEPVKQNSGIASAILGFAAFLAGGICSPLAGVGNMMISTSIVMLVCSLTAFVMTLFSEHLAKGCCNGSLNSSQNQFQNPRTRAKDNL